MRRAASLAIHKNPRCTSKNVFRSAIRLLKFRQRQREQNTPARRRSGKPPTTSTQGECPMPFDDQHDAPDAAGSPHQPVSVEVISQGRRKLLFAAAAVPALSLPTFAFGQSPST